MNRLVSLYVPVWLVGLVASEAILLSFAYVLASFAFLTSSPEVVLLEAGGWQALAVVPLAVLAGLHLQDLYSPVQVHSWTVLLQELCLGFGFALLGEAAITYLTPALRVPVHVMVAGSILAIVLVALWRPLYLSYVRGVVGNQRVLFVGGSPLVEEIAAWITRRPELGLAVAGYVGDSAVCAAGKQLGRLDRLGKIVETNRPDRVVVGLTERRRQLPVRELLKLREAGYIVEEAATTYEVLCGRVATRDLRPMQLVLSPDFAPRPDSLRYQSAFNFAFALVSLVLALPCLLLAALATRLFSPGPILYSEPRVGRGGRVYMQYRFRLHPRGEKAETGSRTAVGRVLERLGLDRLPVLWSVLSGDMSIVGPRAVPPESAANGSRHIPYYRYRQTVKPGLTGWAQTHEADLEEPLDARSMLEYDLYYIRHMSFSLDVYILLRTFKRLLRGRAARAWKGIPARRASMPY